MFDWDKEPHPLYPEQTPQKQRKIHLYPPKTCDKCSKEGFDVEWKEVSFVESSSLWYGTGHTSTIRSELVKWCSKCLESHNNMTLWG